MAKKVNTQPAAAPVAPTVRSSENDLFVRVLGPDGKGVPPTGKVAPQMTVVLNTIEAAGPEGIKREALSAALKGVLVTRQPEGRIVTYYQKAMVAAGAITLTKAQ